MQLDGTPWQVLFRKATRGSRSKGTGLHSDLHPPRLLAHGGFKALRCRSESSKMAVAAQHLMWLNPRGHLFRRGQDLGTLSLQKARGGPNGTQKMFHLAVPQGFTLNTQTSKRPLWASATRGHSVGCHVDNAKGERFVPLSCLCWVGRRAPLRSATRPARAYAELRSGCDRSAPSRRQRRRAPLGRWPCTPVRESH